MPKHKQKPLFQQKQTHLFLRQIIINLPVVSRVQSKATLTKKKKTEKQARNKSPNKSSDRILSDRLPNGSDDPIQQHKRFHCLNEDMEAENSPAESTNKQGRIIKINNKK